MHLCSMRINVTVVTAAQNGETALHLAAQSGHVDAAEELIGAGANPNLRDMVLCCRSTHSASTVEPL